MPTATPRAESRWRTAVDEQVAALAAYLDAAERIPDAAWMQPYAPGKWTPAEITEHLTMTYRVFIGEVNGGPGMRLKLTPFRRRMLKLLLLPHMLYHRTFPRRAPAPRELRPDAASLQPKARALADMRALGDRFIAEAEKARAGGWDQVTHPYFGAIDLTRGMRLCSVHIEHHTRQIASVR
jgi:hypothetical protein